MEDVTFKLVNKGDRLIFATKSGERFHVATVADNKDEGSFGCTITLEGQCVSDGSVPVKIMIDSAHSTESRFDNGEWVAYSAYGLFAHDVERQADALRDRADAIVRKSEATALTFLGKAPGAKTCDKCKFYMENPRCSTGNVCLEYKQVKPAKRRFT